MTFLALVLFGTGLGLVSFVLFTALGWPRTPIRRVTLALAWVWASGVVALTLVPGSWEGRSVNLAPLDISNEVDLVDFALNILMFAPAGILLALAGVRAHRAVVAGFLASLAIETIQFVSNIGRITDINDLVSNTLGCALGYLFVCIVREAVRVGQLTPARR